MKKEIDIRIGNIYLGKKIEKDPKNDRYQYLVVDEFNVKTIKGAIYINIKKHHIKEYPIDYCIDCLAEGKRNTNTYYGTHSKTEHWYRCKEHYAKYIRKKYPEKRCPKCKVGALVTCGIEKEDVCCTHCNYRKNIRPLVNLGGWYQTAVIPETVDHNYEG